MRTRNTKPEIKLENPCNKSHRRNRNVDFDTRVNAQSAIENVMNVCTAVGSV